VRQDRRVPATTPTVGPEVRRATLDDVPWVSSSLVASWGSTVVARRGALVDAAAHLALVAILDGARCGLAVHRRDGDDAELVSIAATTSGRGVGTALLAAVVAAATEDGAKRLWLVTTNDNLDALRFYQRRGLHLVAVRPGAVAEARRRKPAIPEVGHFGIPIRDELELVLELESA
jgi:N-acetylglutamate synthase-like GNAT family acetyltransferase